MTRKLKHLSLRIDEDLLRKFEYVAKYEIADFEEKHGEIPTASDSKTE